jgi:predicted TIM-barrel fold metal-dependent hydrolase
MSEAASLLMFASNYPYWSTMSAADALPQVSGPDRQRLLHGNAAALYRL